MFLQAQLDRDNLTLFSHGPVPLAPSIFGLVLNGIDPCRRRAWLFPEPLVIRHRHFDARRYLLVVVNEADREHTIGLFLKRDLVIQVAESCAEVLENSRYAGLNVLTARPKLNDKA